MDDRATFRAAQRWWIRKIYDVCPRMKSYADVPDEALVGSFADLFRLYVSTMEFEATPGRLIAFIMYCRKTQVDPAMVERLLLSDVAFARHFVNCLAAL